MNNAKAIRALIQCARSANHMATHYARMDMGKVAAMWHRCRDHHMATARQLRADQ